MTSFATHDGLAAEIRRQWPNVPRAVRRAAARRFWKTSQRTEKTWPEQWRAINAGHGVVQVNPDQPPA